MSIIYGYVQIISYKIEYMIDCVFKIIHILYTN